MRSSLDPKGWADSLFGAALLLLGAALAMYLAVKLILSVAVVLITSLMIVAAVWSTLVLRQRRRDDTHW